MSAARDEVLGRIRQALRDVPPDERHGFSAPRGYRRSGRAASPALVAQFIERVVEYRAGVVTASASQLLQAIERACCARGVERLVVPADLPPGWRPATLELVEDSGLDAAALDQLGAVLTGCALAVAETGTIVLDGGAAQGRRAISLLPDYHLCVIEARQIVELLPEAFALLAPDLRGRHAPITLISGPSATSDIELSRVEGVHGPRTLDVIVVTS